jgi:hypothetical protein
MIRDYPVMVVVVKIMVNTIPTSQPIPEKLPDTFINLNLSAV